MARKRLRKKLARKAAEHRLRELIVHVAWKCRDDPAPLRLGEEIRALAGHQQKTAEAQDRAVRELLFLAGIEGISRLSRGGKGCVFRAVEALRPDIAALWAEDAEPADLLRRFFPDSFEASDLS
jgi:hypothetical protein